MLLPTTNLTIITNTVYWFPSKIIIPITSASDIIIATAKDITADLCQSQQNPLLPPTNTQTLHALVQLNEIFFNVIKPDESTYNNIWMMWMITIKPLMNSRGCHQSQPLDLLIWKPPTDKLSDKRTKLKIHQKHHSNHKYQRNQRQFLNHWLAQRISLYQNLVLPLQISDAASTLLDQPLNLTKI